MSVEAAREISSGLMWAGFWIGLGLAIQTWLTAYFKNL